MLTREQITRFAALSGTFPRPCDDRVPAFMLHRGLVQVGRGDKWELSPAGHDLLATVPHLSEPEPEPAPPPCSRCGGETEIPLFMGPLMMPCPACSNDDGSPKGADGDVIDASYTVVSSEMDAWQRRVAEAKDEWRASIERTIGSIFKPSNIIRVDLSGRALDAPVGDGWVHIDSEAKAKAFIGCMVEVHALAGDEDYLRPVPE